MAEHSIRGEGFSRPAAVPESNVPSATLNFQGLEARGSWMAGWIAPLHNYLETNQNVSCACLKITSWENVAKLLFCGEICLIFLKSFQQPRPQLMSVHQV